MRARNILLLSLSAVYALLFVGGIASRFLTHVADPPWAAPLFLLLAATIIAIGSAELRSLAIFGIGGFLVELIGVNTCFPFGRYQYVGGLGPSIAGVPVAMACAWVALLFWTRDLAWRIKSRPWVAVCCGAALMPLVDMLIDPVATLILGYWRWNQTGILFGVPLVNFIGWFFVSALLLYLGGRPRRRSESTVAVGISIVVFFGLIAAGPMLRGMPKSPVLIVYFFLTSQFVKLIGIGREDHNQTR